jgi:CBS domain-containing protein
LSIIDICKRDVVTLGRDDTVSHAAKLMRQQHIGDVLVTVKKHGKLEPIGIVTDRDIVIEIIAPGLDPNVITVGDIMQPNLFTVKEDAGVFDAIKIMTSKGVRRLPVIKKDGALAGIITLDDLFLMMAKEFCSFAKLLTKQQKNEALKRR